MAGRSISTGKVGRVLLVFAPIVLCLGCRTVNEVRLVGTYHAYASCVDVRLVVNPDHSFVQTAWIRGASENELSGSWSIDKKDRTITFKPFLDFLNDDHGRQLGFASFSPEVFGTVLELGPIIVKCPDSDHEINYSK